MPIQIIGPDWPSIRALRAALAEVPENGSLRWAIGHANKLEQLQVMAAAGVEVVPFTEDYQEVHRHFYHGKEVWLGRRFHHKEGRDILFPDRKFWRTRDYWTRFVPSREEWRIHIFDGRSIMRSRKVESGSLADDSAPHTRQIRNYRNGWRFEHGAEAPKGLRSFAKKMVAACGYLYGACDILVKEDGGFCGLEVNSAPEMSPATLAAYVKAIRKKFATS